MPQYKTIKEADSTKVADLAQISHQLQEAMTDHDGAAQSGRINELMANAEKLSAQLVRQQTGLVIKKGTTRVKLRSPAPDSPVCYGPTSHTVSSESASILVQDFGIYVLSGITAMMLRGTLITEAGDDTGDQVDIALFAGQEIKRLT